MPEEPQPEVVERRPRMYPFLKHHQRREVNDIVFQARDHKGVTFKLLFPDRESIYSYVREVTKKRWSWYYKFELVDDQDDALLVTYTGEKGVPWL